MTAGKTILVTGGAGFIGANAALHFAETGWRVVILDNLSRRGSNLNLEWLKGIAPVEFRRVDVRDPAGVRAVVAEEKPSAILHLAGQVAVTTSLIDPRADFEINALGTLNVLEAVRGEVPEALVLYASTNKVFGRMDDVGVEERNGRYELKDLPEGVSENERLDFHSPYGCSKGAADQYVLDYHKSFGLRTVVFRQSCIYGQRQLGVEDQGWVAWFLIAAVMGREITVYGDGKQIRDLLHVDDLIALYDTAIAQPDVVAGKAYNVGGGPENTLSINELLGLIRSEFGLQPEISRGPWRVGDQPVFVTNIAKASRELGWTPKVQCASGVKRLMCWIQDNRSLFEGLYGSTC